MKETITFTNLCLDFDDFVTTHAAKIIVDAKYNFEADFKNKKITFYNNVFLKNTEAGTAHHIRCWQRIICSGDKIIIEKHSRNSDEIIPDLHKYIIDSYIYNLLKHLISNNIIKEK